MLCGVSVECLGVSAVKLSEELRLADLFRRDLFGKAESLTFGGSGGIGCLTVVDRPIRSRKSRSKIQQQVDSLSRKGESC